MVDVVQEDEFNKDELDTKKDLVVEEDELIGVIDDDLPLEVVDEDEDEEDKDEDDDLTTYLFGDDYDAR